LSRPPTVGTYAGRDFGVMVRAWRP